MIGDVDLVAHITICQSCSDRTSDEYDREERERKARELWEECIPETYRKTDTQHPDFLAQSTTARISQSWLRGDQINGQERMLCLGIIGESGKCKSRIIAQLCKRLIWQGKHVTWINSARFQWCAQNQFNDSSSQEAKKELSRCLYTANLVFDDIGSLKATEAVSDSLYAILEHRTSNGLPIMWTSNETEKEILVSGKISEKARERSVSRLIGFSNIINLSI